MKKQLSWTPYTNNLMKACSIVDNELENSIEALSLFSKAHIFGLSKKKGFSVPQVLFSILIWPLLGVHSLHFFCGNRLSAFITGGKDVLYNFLKRQSINWRGFRFHTAKQFYKVHNLDKESIRAAVFDDTIRHRRGKQVSAVSSHFDHTLGKTVMGQQILEMGLATPKGYVPVDSQIYIGDQKAQSGKKMLADYRSTVGKDYSTAKYRNKNQILRSMLKRAVNYGLGFTHVVADSWFGNKENIKAVLSEKLTGIFRMRQGRLLYYLNGKRYTATELHALVKRRMKRLKGTCYRTVTLNVHLDLSNDKKSPDLRLVKLLFSSSAKQQNENWVLFLSTDTSLSPQKILETYALRWGIEIYFKEAKQHFGLLKEQTGDYAVHYASIHLSAIRFLLVAHGTMTSGESFGTIRDKITRKLELLTFARLLWELFKALIYGVLNEMKSIIDSATIEMIKKQITVSITDFLEKALQLDEDYTSNELKAEKLGLI
jgi:hypothetical protein